MMSPLSCGPAGIVPMLSVGTGRAPRSRSASSVRKAAPRHGVTARCASQPAALPAARPAVGRPCSNSLFCFPSRDHMQDRRMGHACSPAAPALRPAPAALHCLRRPSGMQRRRRGSISCFGLARAAAAASPESPAQSSRLGRVWFSLVCTALHRRPGGWCSRGLLRRRASRKDFEGKRAASTGRPAGYARRMRSKVCGPLSPVHVMANSVAFISALNA